MAHDIQHTNGVRDSQVAAVTNGETVDWTTRSRLVLTPIAAPSILGLFGFMGATLMVAAWMAGWYGNGDTPLYLFPFALTFGGLAQFLAGMWSYRARDGLATAMHGTWGAFWIGFGILQLLFATKVLTPVPLGQPDVNFAFWFIVLAAITMMGALGALRQNLALFAVLATLATGSGFAAAGFYGGFRSMETVAGWLFVFSAGFAWYTASALMLENSYGRMVLPVGKWNRAANVPGAVLARPIEYSGGMPGAKVGQ